MSRSLDVLVVDANPYDRQLLYHAFEEIGPPIKVHHLSDRAELIDYLKHEGQFAAEPYAPRPDLILLDWELPELEGRNVLRLIQAVPELQGIVLILITGWDAGFDTVVLGELGVQALYRKPIRFENLVALVKRIAYAHFNIHLGDSRPSTREQTRSDSQSRSER